MLLQDNGFALLKTGSSLKVIAMASESPMTHSNRLFCFMYYRYQIIKSRSTRDKASSFTYHSLLTQQRAKRAMQPHPTPQQILGSLQQQIYHVSIKSSIGSSYPLLTNRYNRVWFTNGLSTLACLTHLTKNAI